LVVPVKPELVVKLKPSTGASTKTPCLVGSSELPHAASRHTVAINERLNKFFMGGLSMGLFEPIL
jgi:hypothetical protein